MARSWKVVQVDPEPTSVIVSGTAGVSKLAASVSKRVAKADPATVIEVRDKPRQRVVRIRKKVVA